MSEFRECFQKLIEESYIPFNADPVARTDVWHQIYRLVLPNIPEKLFRYRSMNDYSLTEFRNGMISLCHAGMFPDNMIHIYMSIIRKSELIYKKHYGMRCVYVCHTFHKIILILEQKKPQKFVIIESVGMTMNKSLIK